LFVAQKKGGEPGLIAASRPFTPLDLSWTRNDAT
jgi:hypothetical protein